MSDRFVTQTIHDRTLDVSLRPSIFQDFTGQAKVKERLELAVEAAKLRHESLDHILLSGPPGLGKTTLAHILAKAMGGNLIVTSGPVIEKAGDLAGLFTLIGATTRSGLLTAPMRSRFGLTERLDYYSAGELAGIITRAAGILDVKIDAGGAKEIAGRSRGTPRIANNLLKRCRDFAQVKAGNAPIDAGIADKALAMLEIDEHGLDEMDKRILETLVLKFAGKPVGINSLAVAVGEEPDTLEEVYEPFLIMEGYIQRTPQGRIPTELAFKKLGVQRGKPTNELF